MYEAQYSRHAIMYSCSIIIMDMPLYTQVKGHVAFQVILLMDG